ncbi:hypothetical protein ACXR8U_27285 [Methylobacterium radiotolerans]|uniref:hypothetical protein n=1 Tax=Methylobacterium TaxID=407 RepID=UPI0004676C5B|nr:MULTISPECIES: hypothetical protein [Methylobacterium]KZC01105.1 hypothetical protein AU375_02575 [Methylobacterium radiotolerans]MBN6819179.1 hypothetical protein [Methylobacterium organophilum]OXE40551.1 hypothetical protein CCS92_18930 [Methylobacterium radiotolerans]GAN49831.1 hypothetical protein ME121_3866 [Methylobacterium sp. ME121]
MLIAFSGASGRTDASHASLLAAHAATVADGAATLLASERVAVPGSRTGLRHVRFRETASAGEVARAAEACLRDGGPVFVDLPSRHLRAGAVRALLDASVLVVGPHAADEREAAAWRAAHTTPVPTWYLGCRRAGGAPAAARFAAAMALLDPDGPTLPCAVPPLGRGEASGLADGTPGGHALRVALTLLGAVRRATGAPGRNLPPEAREDEARRIGEAADVRSLPERLRDLADDVEAAEAGLKPTADDLAGAPVLDGWSCDAVFAPVLKGRVTGHPGIAEGHRVRTSEVYLTDRATFARTLSRWYVLRTPAGDSAGAVH